MALRSEGFKRETYETIVSRMEQRARELYGENVNTSDRSALGKLIRTFAYSQSELWQDVEDVYYSGFVKTAYGRGLDMLATRYGTTRNPATHAWDYVKIFTLGDVPIFIPMGTTLATEDDKLYYTLQDAYTEDGMAEVEVMAVEPGAIGNTAAHTITKLLNPISGISDLYNEQALTNGENIESDASLKRRLNAVVDGLGGATAKAIEAKLLTVGGVRSVLVDENYTTDTNAFGTPSNAIQCFVLGGHERDIAQAILSSKAAGIEPYGTELYTVDIGDDKTKDIYFSRPQTASVGVFVDVATDARFAVDGVRQVNDVVFSSIGGYDAENNVVHDSPLKMGETIITAKILSKLFAIEGVNDAQIRIVKDGRTHVNSNVYIDPAEIADCDFCTVSVVDEIA